MPIISFRSLYCFRSSLISVVVVPEPFAIRWIREVCFSRISGVSISCSVIEEIAFFQWDIFCSCFVRTSFGTLAADIPGIMPISLSMLPSLFICSSWACKSRRVNFPSFNLASAFFCCFSEVADLTCSNNLWRSPIPSNLDMKDSGSKVSISWICSPTPMKNTGAFVSAHAVRAPPAFDVPSIRVIITPSTDRAFWNSWAWVFAACPMSAGITRIR